MPYLNSMVAERESHYGDFRDVGAVSQQLKDVVRNASSWAKMDLYQREAIEMILHKVARIACGDPDYADSWDDIGGYAKITKDRLPKSETPKG